MGIPFRGVGEAEMLTEKAVTLRKTGHTSGNDEEMGLELLPDLPFHFFAPQ